MRSILFLYKGLQKLYKLLLCNPFCYTVTLLMMYVNGVRHSSFHTNGIPIISVSYKTRGRVTIGDNLRMNNGNTSNNIGFTTRCTFVVAGGAHLCIGKNVGISQTALCAIGADITIGDNSLFGGGTRVYSSDFHSSSYIDRRSVVTDYKNKKSAPVIIGNDCFIGAGTTILKGVTIGSRTIIGAGSVVTKSIPDDCIAAGNPCRVIKRINI